MKHLILALLCAGCVATTGDLDGAVTEITARIDAAARDAQESAEAARAAWQRGEITYTELQARLQDIRAATLDVAKETTREVVEGVKETIERRPEVVGDITRTIIPGPWGELIAILAGSGAAYAAATRKAKEEAAKINAARDAARLARGEKVSP